MKKQFGPDRRRACHLELPPNLEFRSGRLPPDAQILLGNRSGECLQNLLFRRFNLQVISAQCPKRAAQPGQNQNPVVGLRLPNRTSQGAFLATCFFSCRHQSDIKVRQLPSSASSRPKSACGHRRSQNVIRLVVTPALMETEGLWPIVIKNPVRVEKISALRPARFGRASWMPFPDRNYLNISSVSFRP